MLPALVLSGGGVRGAYEVGIVATDWVRAHRREWGTGPVNRLLLTAVSQRDSDLASYLLFDGGFAGELIRLGRADALARADALRAFFGWPCFQVGRSARGSPPTRRPFDKLRAGLPPPPGGLGWGRRRGRRASSRSRLNGH